MHSGPCSCISVGDGDLQPAYKVWEVCSLRSVTHGEPCSVVPMAAEPPTGTLGTQWKPLSFSFYKRWPWRISVWFYLSPFLF